MNFRHFGISIQKTQHSKKYQSLSCTRSISWLIIRGLKIFSEGFLGLCFIVHGSLPSKQVLHPEYHWLLNLTKVNCTASNGNGKPAIIDAKNNIISAVPVEISK